VSSWATASGGNLHEEPQVPNFGRPGSGPKLKPGMTPRDRADGEHGHANVRTLSDDWTVVTADGQPQRALRAHDSDYQDKPEILTWRERRQSK
jgi:methionyl aminopeptidase